MRCVIVSHTHWDREWYRTFQSFRARLVDTIDCVLDLVAADDGYRFQLDGQTIVLEDYVAIRPEREAELAAACAAGKLAIGPWYVQPDSFLPSGESHVRNLLEGRRVATRYGPCATVAYTPDSFGHPAQFPQLFSGFGLGPFIYWRGNGNEIAELPAEYRWTAPDGSAVAACHLGRGYFNAWGLSDDLDASVERLEGMVGDLRERAPRDAVLLMNGIDHMLPDANTREVSEALAKHTGWEVVRGLLDAYADGVDVSGPEAANFEGELCGGRVANLLPGVWSTRTYLKLDNRRCETLLEGWAEPFSAIGRALGVANEAPALRDAWRNLLANQAHDSICGCSQDRVHHQMTTRYDAAGELAFETTNRMLERIAGLGPNRQVSKNASPTLAKQVGASQLGAKQVGIAVFNPSPYTRTDVVRLPLTGFPSFTADGVNALLSKNHATEGITIDGQPARLVPVASDLRPRLVPDEPVYDVEFVAHDVPAFGFRRMILERAARPAETMDTGREIEADGVRVRARDDGTLDVALAGRTFSGLLAVEDTGDRGDSYDYDPVPASVSTSVPTSVPTQGPDAATTSDLTPELIAVTVERHRHEGGIARLVVNRTFSIPARLTEDRRARSAERVELSLRVEARIAPGVDRVDLDVRLENPARDHRLRLLFPCGVADGVCAASTTFDIAERSGERPDDSEWIHPAPFTFPSQGWISAGGLTVVAPGLNEAAMTAAGEIAVTLVRSVGWLSRPDLTTRPGEAGPALETPEAQCLGRLDARLSLLACEDDERAPLARAAELGFQAVAAGDSALAAASTSLLEVTPLAAIVSALKPAANRDGTVLRLLNPTAQSLRARAVIRFPFQEARSVRLDETPSDLPIDREGSTLELDLPAHALRSVLLT